MIKFSNYLIESNQAEDIPRINRRIRTIQEKYDECPHCKREIGEKELFLVDESFYVWKHSVEKCGGLLRSSEEAEREARKFWNSFKDSQETNEGLLGGRSETDIAVKTALKALKQIANKYNISVSNILDSIRRKKKI